VGPEDQSASHDNESVKHTRAITGKEKSERRQALVGAAVEQVLEEGLEKVTIGSIAKRAGFAKGTLYLYFASKPDIIGAVWDYAIEQWSSELLEVLDDGMDDAGFCEVFLRSCLQNRLFFLVVVNGVRASEPHPSSDSREVRKNLIRELRSHKAAFVDLFERMGEILNLSAGEARYLVLALWALLSGGGAMDLERNLEVPLAPRFNPIKMETFFLRFGPAVIASVRADGV
jgi:AcrR family transcriptional regulator